MCIHLWHLSLDRLHCVGYYTACKCQDVKSVGNTCVRLKIQKLSWIPSWVFIFFQDLILKSWGTSQKKTNQTEEINEAWCYRRGKVTWQTPIANMGFGVHTYYRKQKETLWVSWPLQPTERILLGKNQYFLLISHLGESRIAEMCLIRKIPRTIHFIPCKLPPHQVHISRAAWEHENMLLIL